MLKALTVVGIGDLFSKILSAILAVILIRKLSVMDYSYYTAFTAVMSVVPAIVGTGLNQAMVVYGSSYMSQYNRSPIGLYIGNILVQSSVYIFLSTILGFFCINRIVLLLFGQEDFKIPFLYALIGGFGVLLTQGVRSIFQTEEKFKLFSFTLFLRQLFLLVGICSFLYILDFTKVKYILLLISTISLLFGILLFVYAIFPYGSQIILYLKEQKNIFSKFIKNSYWLIGYWLVLSAFNRLDIFMLSHLSTKKELAYYGVAYQYYAMGVLFLGSIHTVLLPKFSRGDINQIVFLKKWIKFTLLFIVPSFLIIAMFGKSPFVFINSCKYEKSFYIFLIFLIGLAINFIFSPLINIIMSIKRFKILFILSIVAFFVNFLGNYILIPIYAGFGAAFVTIFSISIINVLALLQWIIFQR